MKTVVGIVRSDDSNYPTNQPFDPPELFPEYPHKKDETCKDNSVYAKVRELLWTLGLDKTNFGKKSWNPLGDIASEGDHVVIKPNFVTAKFKHVQLEDEYMYGVTTHAAVIRPMIDYALIATGMEGKVTIVDSPIEAANFQRIIKYTGVLGMVNHLKTEHGVPLYLLDLRDFISAPHMLIDNFTIGGRSLNIGYLKREKREGDPKGYSIIDLKDDSHVNEISDKSDSFRSLYKPANRAPSIHHGPGRHEYSIANTILDADVIINIPKLKTHKKAGVTLSMKNLVGTSNKKHWLPHFIKGGPPHGDEFPSEPLFGDRLTDFLSNAPLSKKYSIIVRAPKEYGVGYQHLHPFIKGGEWDGNDTLWRMILDLNTILFYADKRGVLQPTKQRKNITIIDGIIGGEKEGPQSATPIRSGILIGGLDPLATDVIATTIMGFNPERIKYLSNAEKSPKYKLGTYDIHDITVVPSELKELNLRFQPPSGWRDIIAKDR